MLFWITFVGAMLLGLLLGSFLNVCIVRLPLGESVVRPRSYCRACGAALRATDNVPVMSFLWLRGRCRTCDAQIGWQYPLVELGLAAWFAASYVELARSVQAGLGGTLLGLPLVADSGQALLGFLLLGLMVMDWQTQRLPDLFTLGGLAAGLAVSALESVLLRAAGLSAGAAFHGFGDRVIAAAAGFLLPWTIGALYRLVRRRRGIGLGDCKMLAMAGAFLGTGPMLFALLTGVLLAAAFGVGLLLRGRATATTRLPFGSFLAVGGLLAALVGETAVDWYLSLFAR